MPPPKVIRFSLQLTWISYRGCYSVSLHANSLLFFLVWKYNTSRGGEYQLQLFLMCVYGFLSKWNFQMYDRPWSAAFSTGPDGSNTKATKKKKDERREKGIIGNQYHNNGVELYASTQQPIMSNLLKLSTGGKTNRVNSVDSVKAYLSSYSYAGPGRVPSGTV